MRMSTADVSAALERIFCEERIPAGQAATLAPHYQQLLEDVLALRERRAGHPVVVGICGAQASGKSTLVRVLQAALREGAGLPAAVLSIDDLYLSSAARAQLAAQVHPLLRTRAVPGTHDVNLGIRVIDQLRHARPGEPTLLPRFDKLADEPRPQAQWERFQGPAEVVLFEGWCVGARAQAPAALRMPLNSLERDEDAQGHWRGYVNQQLAGPYQRLFGLLDQLIMLRAPGFEVVFSWRREQEHKLAARARDPFQQPPARVMDDAQLRRFILHYERLTRHILEEMPARADVCVLLDAQRRIQAVERR
jgi:D-glycerate 3-kinase